MAINVRDAVEANLPDIVQIYNSTVPTRMVTADTEPVSVESRRAWFRGHDPACRPLWVAEEEGRSPAGQASNLSANDPPIVPPFVRQRK